jgi:hypothetical protein
MSRTKPRICITRCMLQETHAIPAALASAVLTVCADRSSDMLDQALSGQLLALSSIGHYVPAFKLRGIIFFQYLHDYFMNSLKQLHLPSHCCVCHITCFGSHCALSLPCSYSSIYSPICSALIFTLGAVHPVLVIRYLHFRGPLPGIAADL